MRIPARLPISRQDLVISRKNDLGTEVTYRAAISIHADGVGCMHGQRIEETDGNRALQRIEQNQLVRSEEHQHQKQDEEASRNSSLPNRRLPEREGFTRLPTEEILSLT
jgi:hypothetical protein